MDHEERIIYMNCNNTLLNRIEELRKKLVQVVSDKGYTNEETVKVSQQLDQLLNVYNSRKNLN